MTRRCTGRRPRLRWSRAVAVVAVVLAAFAALPTFAQTDVPPSAADGDMSTVVFATGPFGSVAGMSLLPDQPLPDPTTLEALDAYGRGALVTMTPAEGSLDRWHVTAVPEPVLDPSSVADLGSGVDSTTTTLRLPSSGLFLIRLDGTLVDPTISDDPGTSGSWVWRVAVPDRDVPDGGAAYLPAPAIVLTSGDQSVDLDPGSGCFIGTCGDIGATSPPQTLPTIRTLAGVPLSVHLSDGSGIDSWSADATPIGATDDETIALGHGVGDGSIQRLTFAAPAEGRWVILVHLRFDRDRGSFDGYGRLILVPAGSGGAATPADGPG